MAKLYWRVKRDGKWTWIAATSDNTSCHCHCGKNVDVQHAAPRRINVIDLEDLE